MITQITIGTTNLIDPTNGYFLGVPLSGLEAPAISTDSYPYAGEDGVYIPAMWMRERRIAIQGMLRGGCASDLLELRRVISGLIRPIRNSDNELVPKTMTITDSDGNIYTLSVQVLKLDMPITGINTSEYLLDIIAEDPRMYSSTSSQVTITETIGGGFSIPFSIPFSFSTGVDGSVTINNLGDIESYPDLVFNGPITNPRLTNTTTGEYIQINATVVAGASLYVDGGDKTILLNNATNYLSYMTAGSVWVSIAPGLNTFKLQTSVPAEGGNCVLTYRSSYLSI